MLCLLVHLSCVNKVVGLAPQFRCMPQGMVYVNSFIYPTKYNFCFTVPITDKV